MQFLSAFLDETGAPTLLLYMVIMGVLLLLVIAALTFCMIKTIRFFKFVQKEADWLKEEDAKEKF